MTSETRRVRRDLALGVVLVFTAVLAAQLLVPVLASARETDNEADNRSSGAARVAGLASRPTTAHVRSGYFGSRSLHGSTAVDTTAELTGTTSADVTAALRDGQTLAAYAESHGVTEAALIEAIVAAESARIDQAVSDGMLTQERAGDLKANLSERVTAQVNRTGGPGCRDEDGEEPDDSETQST